LDAEHGSALVPGWFGKMPCLGDFASRRLDADFIDVWDAWLQRSIAASRESLGDAWLDMFLRAPMWRFVLMPGACGPDAWAGLMLPSVDRVGRYFPLTFALRVRGIKDDITSLFAARNWYQGLEQIGLLALSADFSAEALEAHLGRNPFPLLVDTPERREVDDLLQWWREPGAPRSLQLSDGVSLTELMDRSAAALISEAAAGRTLWWSVSPETGTTEVHCATGFPPESYFEVLLRGDPAAQPPEIDAQVLRI
jgi:type VI secretion system protein ImpM